MADRARQDHSRRRVEAIREIARSPRRPALVGFDDFELADLLTPVVAGVSQDAFGLGEAAARLLFRRLEGDNAPVQHIPPAGRAHPARFRGGTP